MKFSKLKSSYLALVIILMAVSLLFQGYNEMESIPQLKTIDRTLISNGTILPQATVSVIQSSQREASDITYEMIKSMIEEAINGAGGFYELINNGDVVLLKPNLISAYDMTNNSRYLPAEVNGMTTDWRVTQAVVEIVRKVNPDGKVFVLEGVANGTTYGNMHHLNYNEDYMTGVDDFIHLEERSGDWREYDAPELVSVTLPTGLGLYPPFKKPNLSHEFYLNKIYYEADVVISLPVLKNHSVSNITGSVKNVGIGATPQNIYGGAPGDNHRFVNNVIDHQPTYLHQWIHDYFLCRPVDYVIMDGLQGSDNGPVGQTGADLEAVQKNMRLILAGPDAVAVDAIACLIMQYDPSKIRHLAWLHNDNGGCADPVAIRVNGMLVDNVEELFFNGINEDINAWYSDDDPPAYTLNSYSLSNGELTLNITSDDDLAKVEVSVDGKFLDEIGVSDFDNLVFNTGDLSGDRHHVTLMVYDKYLNSSSQNLDILTDVKSDDSKFPDLLQLQQNYPNPFNPTTTIEYSIALIEKLQLSASRYAELSVYDMLGRHVATLAGKHHQPGTYTVEFDGSDLPSGTYFYTLSCGEQSLTKSMVLVK